MDSAEEIAATFAVKNALGFRGGMLVANPIPEQFSMDADLISRATDTAIEQARQQGIAGKALTPFLLDRIGQITGGQSLAANIELVCNNARLASAIACALPPTGPLVG
jgi:pseudouridine-5'-phosphate glycosidase